MRVSWLVGMLVAGALAGCLGPEQTPELGEPGTDSFSFTERDGTRSLVSTAPVGVAEYTYTGYTGAEPNMGITAEGNLFVSAFDKTIRSTDGGQTWQTVQNYNPVLGLVERGTSDPMLWVDPQTSRVYVNHMVGLDCFTMLWSDDEGNTWFQRDMACLDPGVDHQKVTSGPYGPAAPFTRNTWGNPVGDVLPDAIEDPVCDLVPPGSPVGCWPGNPSPFNPVYPSALYLCYQKVLARTATAGTEVCLVSFDGGLTYPVESVVFNSLLHGCGGASGHPSVAADGRVAIAHGWGCGPLVAVSRDSGLTWSVHEGPQQWGAGSSIDPDVAWDEAGNLYLMWRDADHMTRVARSSDEGATWDGVWNITAPGLTSTRFHVLSAGSEGRIALAYLGTTYEASAEEEWDRSPHEAPANATWDLYIVTAEDAHEAEPVWNVFQVTPDDDPVQKGCSWEGGGSGGERRCRNLLDFIDSAVHPDGTFYVAYTEGCTMRNGCAYNHTDMDELDARDREVAVAALHGWSLYGPLDDDEVAARTGRA